MVPQESAPQPTMECIDPSKSLKRTRVTASSQSQELTTSSSSLMEPHVIESRFADCKEAGSNFGFPRGRCGVGQAYDLGERKVVSKAISVLSPHWSIDTADVAAEVL